jgi:hypothetical protein
MWRSSGSIIDFEQEGREERERSVKTSESSSIFPSFPTFPTFLFKRPPGAMMPAATTSGERR